MMSILPVSYIFWGQFNQICRRLHGNDVTEWKTSKWIDECLGDVHPPLKPLNPRWQ